MPDTEAETISKSMLERILAKNSPLAPDPRKRAPLAPRVQVPGEWLKASTAAVRQRLPIRPNDDDLTRQRDGRPMGERIMLAGQVRTANGTPIPGVILEIWQANAAGTYIDPVDPLEMPIDPNFIGIGRTITDENGAYRFITIKPAAYPGPQGSGIPYRPAHIHVSLTGPELSMRRITQCYFDGDPLFTRDFVVGGMRNPEDRPALLAHYAPELTRDDGPDRVLGYKWDITINSHDGSVEW
jgi:protocatechuate 3,4-dioxygenase beta subunit